MSLSEQLQRVDGGQIAALKALIQKYGGTVPEGTKIDGYANIINGLGIYSQQEMLSNTTKTALGLESDAVPDDALSALSEKKEDKKLLNSWTSDGTDIVLQMTDFELGIYKILIKQPLSGIQNASNYDGFEVYGQYGTNAIIEAGETQISGSSSIGQYFSIRRDPGSPGYILFTLSHVNNDYTVSGFTYFGGDSNAAMCYVFSQRSTNRGNLRFNVGLRAGMTVELYKE